MQSSSLTADVRNLIVTNLLYGRGKDFDNDSSFMDEGLIDSTGILELVSRLEEIYGIEILDEELTPENLDSINRIASYLTRKLGPTFQPLETVLQPQ